MYYLILFDVSCSVVKHVEENQVEFTWHSEWAEHSYTFT